MLFSGAACLFAPGFYERATFQEQALQTAAMAEVVVFAINQFRQDKGRWPDDLAPDLVPQYLPTLPFKDRRLTYDPTDSGPTLRLDISRQSYATYRFPARDHSPHFAGEVNAGWVFEYEGPPNYLLIFAGELPTIPPTRWAVALVALAATLIVLRKSQRKAK
jgi:hypothetical protein